MLDNLRRRPIALSKSQHIGTVPKERTQLTMPLARKKAVSSISDQMV